MAALADHVLDLGERKCAPPIRRRPPVDGGATVGRRVDQRAVEFEDRRLEQNRYLPGHQNLPRGTPTHFIVDAR